jgi:isopentenyl-diphosphate delta-isomerase
MTGNLSDRKTDHLTLCATGDVGFDRQTTCLQDVRLIHDSLPELAVDEIDLGLTLFGKKLKAPLLIAAMTGGNDKAGEINRELASIAEERGYAFGLGSQRAMHVRHEAAGTYNVRERASSTVVFGNIGVVQAKAMSTREVRGLVDEVGADALCIHLNPAQELIQADGDRDFRGGLDTIKRLHEELGVPVIVKETGNGLSRSVGVRLRSVGVRHVDVSGAGGTSWVAVELRRAEQRADQRGQDLGLALRNWGVPTGVSVALLQPLGFDTIIATGGVSTGLDAARAIALGAHVVGIARPVLQAFHNGGRDGAIAALTKIETVLRATLLLTGSRDLAALRRAPRVITGELAAYVEQLGGNGV